LLLCLLVAASAAVAGDPALIATSAPDFNRQHDLVLSPDKRFLYVADLGNNDVKVLDPASLRVIGRIGVGELSAPHDVAIDRAGRLMVADSGNDRIAIYTLEGNGGTLVESLTGLSSPEGMAQGRDGKIFVADTASGSVVVFQDGKEIARQRAPHAGSEPYRRPHDLDIDGKGRVFVVDSGNNRIILLDQALKHLATLGKEAYGFNDPKYLAFDRQGRTYIADEYNDVIKILDADFALIARIGTGERGPGPGQLNKPEGVTVSDNQIWVSDTYNHRILLYRWD